MTSTGENRTTTSRDGPIIAYTKRGSGRPLIIVDGAFCYRENGPATELATLLAHHFAVVFVTHIYGAPRAFVFAMPFLMPNAWQRNKLVAHTLPYDLTILDDRSVLNARSSSISVPTPVIGGEKSPKELRDAVVAVANAVPNGSSRFLPGQDHNISRVHSPRSYLSISLQARLFSCIVNRYSPIRGDAEAGTDEGQVRSNTHTHTKEIHGEEKNYAGNGVAALAEHRQAFLRNPVQR